MNRHATCLREDTDPDCLAPPVVAALLMHVDGHRMVVVGDSVAAGIREPLAGYRDRSFADRVGDGFAYTREAFSYRNLGVRDLRLAQIRKTQLDEALAFDPDLALIAAGGNDALARSLFLCGAAKDAGAERVTALVPYLAYARKDRRTKPRDPVTTRYVATREY